jgi:hypothetical protein
MGVPLAEETVLVRSHERRCRASCNIVEMLELHERIRDQQRGRIRIVVGQRRHVGGDRTRGREGDVHVPAVHVDDGHGGLVAGGEVRAKCRPALGVPAVQEHGHVAACAQIGIRAGDRDALDHHRPSARATASSSRHS